MLEWYKSSEEYAAIFQLKYQDLKENDKFRLTN